MRFSEILHLVWINILESKTKVMLTSLGIIVGAATIVLVIAIGHGGEVDVQEQFKTLNVGAINVTVSTQADMADAMAGMMPPGDMGGGGGFSGGFSGGTQRSFSGGSRTGGSGGGGMPGGGQMGGGGTAQKGVTLTTTDVEDILSYVPDLSSASIVLSGTGAVLTDNLDEETDETIVGCLPEYQNISNLELLQGDFITQDDEDSKNKVAVIGNSLAKTLFGSAYAAYGDVLTIEGKTYTVVGVLSEIGTVSSGVSPDDSIYLPYSTAQKFVLGSTATPSIMAIASDVKEVSNAMANITAVLTENYPNGRFTLTDAGSEMEAATTSANTLSMLLIAVAIIVFIVGGIGIMNVLFVSVRERTQEIGILKALGCSKREILLEFLVEANFMSTFGGVLGVIVGFALVPAVRMAGMTVEPLAVSGVLALAFAVVTGTAFGFYPAYKAAQLTPIEALQQE
ncbi:ABC transporter permease [Caproiciproducens sp. CPB-2]|uniref:ABC transporter permease n=1 Tax=unclassified Caproiciproducens TaxID=2643836 RepID=UPI0023DCAB0E|nr:ABC transporter permease [Caproiciproducens sp. CPB-2]MDF1495373.1 ABC transporter permease [Caproiciproducens sp. CPB-2]